MSYIRPAMALPLYLIALAAHHAAVGFMWLSDRSGDAAKWVLED